MKLVIKYCVQLLIVASCVSGLCFGQTEFDGWAKFCVLTLVPNEIKTKYNNDSSKSFRYSYCGSNYTEQNDANSTEILDVFTSDNSIKKITKSEFCTNESYVAVSKTVYDYYAKFVTNDQLKSFNVCMADYPNQIKYPPPLIVYSENAADNLAIISTKWDKNVTDKQPVFSQLSVSPNLTCPIPGTKLPWESDKLIKDKYDQFQCKWNDTHSTSGFVSVASSVGSGFVKLDRTIVPLGHLQVVYQKAVEYIDRYDSIFGNPVGKDDFTHNKKCIVGWAVVCPPYVPMGDGWIGQNTLLTLDLPSEVRSSDIPLILAKLRLECSDGGNGSCAWNDALAPRLTNIEVNGSRVSANRVFGSKGLLVKLASEIPKYRTRLEERQLDKLDLTAEKGGMIFSFRVPTGSQADLKVDWADGTSNVTPVGGSSARIEMVPSTQEKPNPTIVGENSIYTYRVKWKSDVFAPSNLYFKSK